MRRVTSTVVARRWGPELDQKLRELYEHGTHVADIAGQLNCTKAAVESRVNRLDLRRPMKPAAMRRPPPADLAEVAARMTRSEMTRHYFVSRDTVIRWINETGVECLDLRKRGIPSDFATVAPMLTKAELSDRFDKDPSTIERWLRVCGVRAHKVLSLRNLKLKELEEEKTRPPEVRQFREKVKAIAPVAADFLRKHYSAVFRCDIKLWEARSGTWGSQRGLPDYGKNQYFVAGKGPMWIDELIELAVKHGFNVSDYE